VLVVAGAEFTM